MFIRETDNALFLVGIYKLIHLDYSWSHKSPYVYCIWSNQFYSTLSSTVIYCRRFADLLDIFVLFKVDTGYDPKYEWNLACGQRLLQLCMYLGFE